MVESVEVVPFSELPRGPERPRWVREMAAILCKRKHFFATVQSIDSRRGSSFLTFAPAMAASDFRTTVLSFSAFLNW